MKSGNVSVMSWLIRSGQGYAFCNDHDGALRSTSLSMNTIVSVLSPQLLIPPHSVQAEASGGTVKKN